MKITAVMISGASAAAIRGKSCLSADFQHRVDMQNKLAGICEDMCKEVGAYPQCAQCPGFVAPDSTPGVMTWDELLEHMDNLVGWGQDEIKGWKSQASALQKSKQLALVAKHTAVATEKSCLASDLKLRESVQNKLAGICEDMCKEVGAYPQCAQCPGFVAPDSTPGVMTWDELLEHMDNLVGWGADEIKGWKSQAALLQGENAGTSMATFAKAVSALKAKNPLFSEEACTEMFSTKLKLGGTVPPANFVVGCVEVCDAVKALKDYWGSGEMATFACGQGASYGCVYDGTPPVPLSGIGC
jgi:predicted DNA-binding transcriptional regulator AlpA